MDDSPGPLHQALAPLLRAALVVALAAAGWSAYRRLPELDASLLGGRGGSGPTALRLVLRRPAGYPPPSEQRVSLQLFSVNVAEARREYEREYEAERRPGVRFDDFLLRRMRGRPPVTAEFDERDEASVFVPQGRWWVHATLRGPEELNWRLPVNVAGPEKTVVLSAENVYTRAKSF